MSDIDAEVFVDFGPRPPVRREVRGSWGCQCGTVRHPGFSPVPYVESMDVECRYCGDSARLLPETTTTTTPGRTPAPS